MTQKRPAGERRHEIIEAAVHEFIERGYEGASMQSIADRAGLTKGGVYHHFRGKEEILIAANDVFVEPVERMLKDLEVDPSPKRGLRIFIHKVLAHWHSHPRELEFTFLSLARCLADERLLSYLEEYVRHRTDIFTRVYRHGIEAKEFRKMDVQCYSAGLVAALDGVTAFLLTEGPLSLQGAMRNIVEVFVNSIVTDTSA